MGPHYPRSLKKFLRVLKDGYLSLRTLVFLSDLVFWSDERVALTQKDASKPSCVILFMFSYSYVGASLTPSYSINRIRGRYLSIPAPFPSTQFTFLFLFRSFSAFTFLCGLWLNWWLNILLKVLTVIVFRSYLILLGLYMRSRWLSTRLFFSFQTIG